MLRGNITVSNHWSDDNEGVMICVIAVVLLYTFSCILMVESSMTHTSSQDQSMHLYLKESKRSKIFDRRQKLTAS